MKKRPSLPSNSVVLAALLTGSTLLAADESAADVRFRKADTNGDGRISRQEYTASVREKTAWWALGKSAANTEQNALTPELFNALDRDRDGYLTPEEVEAGRRLRESIGDDGSGASVTRDVNPPGTSASSSKGRTQIDPPPAKQPPPEPTR